MIIETKQTRIQWRADCLDLPGMPPVGEGATEQEALVCLFFRMYFDKPGPHTANWWSFIKKKMLFLSMADCGDGRI